MSRVSTNIVANFLAQGWSAVLQLALVPFYLHFLGVEAYALVGFYIMLITSVQIFDLGIAQTLNRELARRSSDPASGSSIRTVARTLELVYWGVVMLACALLALLVPTFSGRVVRAETLDTAVIASAMYLMVAVIGCNWPANLYSGGLMGLQRQVLASGLRALFATISGVGAVLTLWLFAPTITAFFTWQLAAAILAVLGSALALHRSLPRGEAAFSAGVLKDTWRFAAGVSGLSISSLLLTQMDKWILVNLVSLKTFGFYVLALTVANSLLLVVTPVFNAMFPRLAALAAKGDQHRSIDLYHLATQLLATLVVPAAALLSAFSPQVLFLWTQNAEVAEGTARILSLFVIGTALNGLMHMPYALELARGTPRTFLTINVLAVLVQAPALWFLVTWIGPVGAAVTWIALNASYFPLALPRVHSGMPAAHRRRWLVNDVLIPASVSVAVIVAARLGLPGDLGSIALGLYLFATLAAAVALAALSAPELRKFIGSRIAAGAS